MVLNLSGRICSNEVLRLFLLLLFKVRFICCRCAIWGCWLRCLIITYLWLSEKLMIFISRRNSRAVNKGKKRSTTTVGKKGKLVFLTIHLYIIPLTEEH